MVRKLVLALCLLSLGGGPAHAAALPDRYVVVLKDGVDAGAVAAEHARRDHAQVSHVYGTALRGYAARLSPEALTLVQKDPRVQFVEPDLAIAAESQLLPTGIDRIDADLSSTRSGDGAGSVPVNVAVIDTGIDLSHPDLGVVGGKDCTGSGSYGDGNGHGTHVAGTIGARDDGSGVVGVAPGARLWAVRVLDSTGSGSISSVICGIDWVTANAPVHRIKIANMSLGGSGADDGNCGNTNGDAMHKAICGSTAKGVTYVAAAGNDGTDFRSDVPATYKEVLTVTAMADFDGRPGQAGAPKCMDEYDDAYATFSNYAVLASDQSHTVAAPGVCIRSTYKGSAYATLSGTSMATPHVAGMVALCISAGACSGTPAQIIARIRADAAAFNEAHVSYGFVGDPVEPLSGRYYGYLVRAGVY
jgi:subtilisin family serine protease